MAETQTETRQPQAPIDKVDEYRALLRRSLRYVWIAVLLAFVGGAAAVGFGLLRGRSYESRTVIMFRELIPTRILQGGDAPSARRDLATRFKEMARSEPLLKKVIREHDLYPETRAERGMTAALEEMRQAVRFRSRGGGTFHLYFRGTSPKQAQEVTQGLARRLIERERSAHMEGVEATREFLANERLRAEEELHDKERALAQFLAEYPEFAQETAVGLVGAKGASIRAQQQKKEERDRDARLRALRRQRARLQARLGGQPVPVADEKLEEAHGNLAEARQELRKEKDKLRELRARYTDRHPDVALALRRVERAERRVAMAKKTAGALEAASDKRRAPVEGEEKRAIERDLKQIEAAIAARRKEKRGGAGGDSEAEEKVVDLEARWARLSREVEEAQERYEAIESKAFTAEIVATSEIAGKASQLSILDPASKPSRPAGIPLRLLALAGFTVFGGIGGLLAIGLGLTDDRIASSGDLERLGIARPVAMIPRAGRKRRRSRHG